MLVSILLASGMYQLPVFIAVEDTPLTHFFFGGGRDFLLKQELLRAISDLGFEHPSEGVFLIFIVMRHPS
jgi:hypothetical protein